MNKPVYLKLKPEYEHLKQYKYEYIVYNYTENKNTNNINFTTIPYQHKAFEYLFREVDDYQYEVITEQEFKMEVL